MFRDLIFIDLHGFSQMSRYFLIDIHGFPLGFVNFLRFSLNSLIFIDLFGFRGFVLGFVRPETEKHMADSHLFRLVMLSGHGHHGKRFVVPLS